MIPAMAGTTMTSVCEGVVAGEENKGKEIRK